MKQLLVTACVLATAAFGYSAVDGADANGAVPNLKGASPSPLHHRPSPKKQRAVGAKDTQKLDAVIPYISYSTSFTNQGYNNVCNSNTGSQGERVPFTCQPFILGGYATTTCSSSTITYQLYNTPDCSGNSAPLTYNTSKCIPLFGNTAFFYAMCHLAPYFTITQCNDAVCGSNCGASQNVPLAVCQPYFLGGYAVANAVYTNSGSTNFQALTFSTYSSSDCSGAIVSNMTYPVQTCSAYATAVNGLGYVSFTVSPNP